MKRSGQVKADVKLCNWNYVHNTITTTIGTIATTTATTNTTISTNNTLSTTEANSITVKLSGNTEENIKQN